jgi:hypothetical protein
MMKRLSLVLVALAAATPTVALAGNGNTMGMGPMHRMTVTSFLGFYDGHKDVFLSTDISSRAEATAEHINFSGKLGASNKTAEEIYMVNGSAAVGQLPVFSSEPGEPTYTPLWHEEFVTWKSGVTPKLLLKDDQITKLEKQGMLSVRDTKVVLNCPIIKVGK